MNNLKKGQKDLVDKIFGEYLLNPLAVDMRGQDDDDKDYSNDDFSQKRRIKMVSQPNSIVSSREGV